jgi:hypothetical protein
LMTLSTMPTRKMSHPKNKRPPTIRPCKMSQRLAGT